MPTTWVCTVSKCNWWLQRAGSVFTHQPGSAASEGLWAAPMTLSTAPCSLLCLHCPELQTMSVVCSASPVKLGPPCFCTQQARATHTEGAGTLSSAQHFTTPFVYLACSVQAFTKLKQHRDQPPRVRRTCWAVCFGGAKAASCRLAHRTAKTTSTHEPLIWSQCSCSLG